MSRHVRNKPGEGPKLYKERKLYFATCLKHGKQYQSFYQKNIRVQACGKCRQAAARISPGQEQLFAGDGSDGNLSIGADLAKGQDQAVAVIRHGKGKHLIINMPRRPGKNTIRKLVGKGRAL